MDPFIEIYKDSVERGKPAEEALAEVHQLVQAPENRAMLTDLSSSDTGQLILLDWQRQWKQFGLQAPWARLVAVVRSRLHL